MVGTRQVEMRSIGARIDALRDNLGRMSIGWTVPMVKRVSRQAEADAEVDRSFLLRMDFQAESGYLDGQRGSTNSMNGDIRRHLRVSLFHQCSLADRTQCQDEASSKPHPGAEGLESQSQSEPSSNAPLTSRTSNYCSTFGITVEVENTAPADIIPSLSRAIGTPDLPVDMWQCWGQAVITVGDGVGAAVDPICLLVLLLVIVAGDPVNLRVLLR
ncbi:hypothetical protein BD410DRAFT_809372 [Rickenella mellea]|uniref:Uncharacterized protein n=1 Tax=Rickenella mellea TaxID=50990 RepID=A0A4Y7PHF2_9AGAM|nr:hypothetical protein BD410DRAFT_809372 [Rickenella mellea]